NNVTNSRVTPSWREIVSLTFSEASILHVNWTRLGHCGIRNVSQNEVSGNEVYVSDLEGFCMNPSSNEFRLCNSDKWGSGNHGGRVIIRGYSGGGDMVVRHGLKGCLDHQILRSSPLLPHLQ
nr:hypothetical protein [Tanacetum cinerariifolium]GEX13029.1 hypothetical protein [Tanacetum cinerariifolium]